MRFNHGAEFGGGVAFEIGLQFLVLEMNSIMQGRFDGSQRSRCTYRRAKSCAACFASAQMRVGGKESRRRESALPPSFQLGWSQMVRH
jgi:hypothetical protein